MITYKEDGRPSQQWYWDDWFSAFDVRLCSLAARGLWIDMLGIMWKAKPRGALIINGKLVDNKMLAHVVNTTEIEVEKLLRELELRNVFSKLENGTIICRRVYFNELERKVLSEKRADAGRKGMEKRWQGMDNKSITNDNKPITKNKNGNNKTITKTTEAEDNKPITGEITKITTPSSSPSSSPIPKKNIYPQDFLDFYDRYPRKKEKKKANNVWRKLSKEKKEFVLLAVDNYQKEMDILQREDDKIKLPATFLNPSNESWVDYLPENWKEPVTDKSGKQELTEQEFLKKQREAMR